MPEESENPSVHRGGWLSTAPQLVVVDDAAFTVTMVVEDRVEVEGHALDYARDRYEILGPVGQGNQRHLWIADHTGALMEHPFNVPPAHLTLKARVALNAWLDWADDEFP